MTDKVLHLEHIDDLVYNEGRDGAARAIATFKHIRESLAGRTTKAINTTVKYDGAPSLFAGIDPSDGRFFVAKKGLFNKEPALFKSQSEIPPDGSDVSRKLSLALKYLPNIGIKGVLQGDFMFSQDELKTVSIHGEDYVTFHPNTIVYAVPKNSALGKQILAAKIGVVWHTTYSGSSIQSLSAKGGQRIREKLKPSRDVWFDDVVMDLSGKITLTANEMEESLELIKNMERLLPSLPNAEHEFIASGASEHVKTFKNQQIRRGSDKLDGSAAVEFIQSKGQQAADKVKSQAAKDRHIASHNQQAEAAATKEAQAAHEFQANALQLKALFIKKMNAISQSKTFLKDSNGNYKVTSHEGYVVTDHLGKNAVKLVDRLEFSRANFSPDIVKGWTK